MGKKAGCDLCTVIASMPPAPFSLLFFIGFFFLLLTQLSFIIPVAALLDARAALPIDIYVDDECASN